MIGSNCIITLCEQLEREREKWETQKQTQWTHDTQIVDRPKTEKADSIMIKGLAKLFIIGFNFNSFLIFN